ncbi:MAG: thiamine pyrophosphate-dependent enzyme [Caldilineaceae bacterium]
MTLGSRLARPMMQWGTDKAMKIIRVDIDPEEHYRVAEPTIGFVARCEKVLPQLVSGLRGAGIAAPAAEELEDIKAELNTRAAGLEPQVPLLKALRAALPDDGYFVDDPAGRLCGAHRVAGLSRRAPTSRPAIRAPWVGAMPPVSASKWPIPAAGSLDLRRRRFLFTVQELSTAVKHKINLVHVVFSDGAYGNVQRMQKLDHGGRVIATDLENPDFVKLAEAFGALGLRAHNPAELETAIQQAFAADRPAVIDVPVGEMPSPSALRALPRVRG